MKDYGRFWQEARKAKGFSQIEIARRIGVSIPYVSAVERGLCRFSLEKTLELIRVLDLDPALVIALLLLNQEQELLKVFRLDKKSCGSERSK